MPYVKNRHPLRHGDRVAFATGPSVRRLKLSRCRPRESEPRFHYDMGTVIAGVGTGRGCVVWDDDEVNVDNVTLSTGSLWDSGGDANYVIVTPESRRTTREERRWRATRAERRLAAYLRANL